jgi:hypothetical protein
MNSIVKLSCDCGWRPVPGSIIRCDSVTDGPYYCPCCGAKIGVIKENDTNRLLIPSLKRGDIIRHKGESDSYVVTGSFGSRVTAAKTVDVTNDIEWVLVSRA